MANEDMNIAKEIREAARAYFDDMKKFMDREESTDELTHHPTLGSLLAAVGKTLSSSLLCLPEARMPGERDRPDYLLFGEDQASGELPKYGAIEIKPHDHDISNPFKGNDAEQMLGYLKRYSLLTITNFREFRLYEKAKNGAPRLLEELAVADSKDEFRRIAENPERAARDHGASILEFLKRAMLRESTMTEPKDVARFLASYAREALAKIKSASPEGRSSPNPLQPLRQELEDALGNPFEVKGKKKSDEEHLFLSTVAQTLFYGMFSAWVEHVKEERPGKFNWRTAPDSISTAVMQTLFNRLVDPTLLKMLGLKSVLDRAGETLNRIDGKSFLTDFESGNAIQHFYQPFLKEFDAESQVDLGVFYTPPEIVEFQVERVDRVLRDELGIEDGLANDSVRILDPCCGTGAYVIEVLRKIHETSRSQIDDSLVGERVKEAAMNRVIGFEIMPAPFLVAHWRVGEFLKSIGASPMSEGERAKIILTNALQGWRPEDLESDMPLFNFQDEHDIATAVKHEKPIMVVIGNPPYNANLGPAPEEEGDLTRPYKDMQDASGKAKKGNLDELYVRFFRIAEMRIEDAGCGVVSFIAGNSWVSKKSFTGMRKHLMKTFHKVWIENMKGSVFKIDGFSNGIKQAVATVLMVKTAGGGVLFCKVSG